MKKNLGLYVLAVLVGVWIGEAKNLHGDQVHGENTSNKGSISGVVVLEGSGQPLGSAKVIVRRCRLEALTNEAGEFTISDVPVGEHLLSAIWRFRSQTIEGVKVNAGENVRIRIVVPDHTWGMTDSVAAAESIGVDVQVEDSEITCQLIPAKDRFRTGDRPEFYVRLTNNSDEMLMLVKYLDGSQRGRFPRVILTANGPEGGLTEREILYCANQNGLTWRDFVELGPGDSFNPMGVDGLTFLRDNEIDFQRSGRYAFTFTYSTDEGDVRYWLAYGQNSVGDDLSEMLRRVPRVSVQCSVVVDVTE